jgi:hypothetical protein
MNYEGRGRTFVFNVLACTHSTEPRRATVPKLPPPPVPLKLQTILKDYPELIQELQDTLNSYVKKPNRLQPFDGAIWILETVLETFMSEAHAELKVAEVSGNMEAIQKAKAKDFSMGYARLNMGGMPDLFDYFQAHKKTFE